MLLFILAALLAAVMFTFCGAAGAKGAWPCSVLAFIYGVALLFVLWRSASDERERKAVDAGHAEYFLDDDRAREWRWLEPCGAVKDN